jgi:hypothetical protein
LATFEFGTWHGTVRESVGLGVKVDAPAGDLQPAAGVVDPFPVEVGSGVGFVPLHLGSGVAESL